MVYSYLKPVNLISKTLLIIFEWARVCETCALNLEIGFRWSASGIDFVEPEETEFLNSMWGAGRSVEFVEPVD